MTTINVALVQFALRRCASVREYLQSVEAVVSDAVQGGAELVVLPEFASIGLLGSVRTHDSTTVTVADDNRHILAPLFVDIAAHAQGLAEKHGITFLAGSHNRIAEDASMRNTAILAHPDGRVEYQDKLHLTPPEHAMGARGGDEVLLTRVGDFTVGVLICADIQYPELSRHLAARGADLILCPSLTWNRRGVYRVRTGCAARAMENQLYVAMSPLVGSSGLPADAPMYAVGRALATVPVDRTFGLNDGVFALATSDGEEIVHAVFDRDVLEASRRNPEPPGVGLQRPELYARLSEGTARDGDL